MSTANLKKIELPRGEGGDMKPAVGYIAMRTQEDGYEFRGKLKRTVSGLSKEGKPTQTHYFIATTAGSFQKLDKKGKSQTISYKAGDEVGINGVAQLNDAVSQVQPGAKLVIQKKGERETEKGHMQLVDTFIDESAAPAAADDNDSF